MATGGPSVPDLPGGDAEGRGRSRSPSLLARMDGSDGEHVNLGNVIMHRTAGNYAKAPSRSSSGAGSRQEEGSQRGGGSVDSSPRPIPGGVSRSSPQNRTHRYIGQGRVATPVVPLACLVDLLFLWVTMQAPTPVVLTACLADVLWHRQTQWRLNLRSDHGTVFMTRFRMRLPVNLMH